MGLSVLDLGFAAWAKKGGEHGMRLRSMFGKLCLLWDWTGNVREGLGKYSSLVWRFPEIGRPQYKPKIQILNLFEPQNGTLQESPA